MNKLKPEIMELLTLVGKKYSRNLLTTTDFDEFSLHLKSEHGYLISTSTLKRLWGYVNDTHQPRTQTLDLLSRYIGFNCFSDFCIHLKTSTIYNSSFFTTRQIQVQNLKPGDEIEIGWSPNRYLRLQYHGEAHFQVIDSKQSKLNKEIASKQLVS